MRTSPLYRFRILALSAGSILMVMPASVPATSLTGFAPPSEMATTSPKDATVKKYVADCVTKAAKNTSCETLRKEAIEILKEDVLTLGSSANREFLPTLLKVVKSDAPELRIAVLDAIGMIGPKDGDAPILARLANDPVPDVRRAVRQTISRGKGSALSLLSQRVMSSEHTGLTPEVPPDTGKFAIPLAPDSTYLFFASDQRIGRLSYIGKKASNVSAFYKGKAKKGPFKLEDFRERYRYQLQDEEEALNQNQEAERKKLETMKQPDPTNGQAFMEYMEKMQSVSAGQSTRMVFDAYQKELFDSPVVYVLEERQIGQRSYPTKYVVLYQELALKRPGYRLAWMTVPDSALKTAQVTSLAEEKEELANKKEAETLKKRQEALDDLTKKKDEAEKKQFKKGQEDLEKELGF